MSQPERPVEPVETRPPLLVVRGDATDEEVAALTAVLQALAAGATAPTQGRRPPSEWSAAGRSHRRPPFHGPGGWRASSLPQ